MKLVILGGGFGGLRLAQKLRNKPGFEITLIDRFNYHQFQPLFYQVATAGLSAPAIAAPIRHLFRQQRNVTTLLGEVTRIDVRANPGPSSRSSMPSAREASSSANIVRAIG